MADRSLTLRLDEPVYQALRRQAYVQERTISDIIRDAIEKRTGTRGPGDPLTVMANPDMPSDDQLRGIASLNSTSDGWWSIESLRALWRNGCDAGMVPPASSNTRQNGDER
jgi:hypothetical protein